MEKDASYHEAAIRYNEEIATFAEDLAPKLGHEEVQRWSRAVAKQHRFHAGRHKRALNKLQEEPLGIDIDDTLDPEPTPGPVMDELDPIESDVDADVETSEEEEVPEPDLDAKIDEIHGEGAADALNDAIEDGSIFSDSHPDDSGVISAEELAAAAEEAQA